MTSTTSPHDADLKAATDHQFLEELYRLFFACTETDRPLDAIAMLYFFGANDDAISGRVYDLCFERALQPLSRIPLREIPPLIIYLGPTDSAAFPRLALGLHFLLDQAPRLALNGTDTRYTLEHFGVLACRLAQDISRLPPQHQSLRLATWTAQGLDFERAWLRSYIAGSALIHAEEAAVQAFGQQLYASEGRESAEHHYGRLDPLREHDEADSKDTTLFPKLVVRAEEGADQLTAGEACWRMCRYIRLHEPIIRVFGRYPYRNGYLGRESTAEEKAWIEETQGFGTAPSEVETALQEDRRAGRWTPLKGADRRDPVVDS